MLQDLRFQTSQLYKTLYHDLLEPYHRQAKCQYAHPLELLTVVQKFPHRLLELDKKYSDRHLKRHLAAPAAKISLMWLVTISGNSVIFA